MTIVCTIFTERLPAAQVPLTTEQLKKLSDKIVVGNVEELIRTSSLIQKLYGRTDYEITVKLETPDEGEPDTIVYKAFAMNYLAPLSPLAGPQGNTIPKQGQRVRLYLKAEKTESGNTRYHVLHPLRTALVHSWHAPFLFSFPAPVTERVYKSTVVQEK